MKSLLAYLAAQCALTSLSIHFDVPVPDLKWNEETTRGQTHWDGPNPVIELGPNVTFGLMPDVLHEFAHVLTEHRTRKIDHGNSFAKYLIEVVDFWGQPYPWEKEYLAVRIYRKYHLEAQSAVEWELKPVAEAFPEPGDVSLALSAAQSAPDAAEALKTPLTGAGWRGTLIPGVGGRF